MYRQTFYKDQRNEPTVRKSQNHPPNPNRIYGSPSYNPEAEAIRKSNKQAGVYQSARTAEISSFGRFKSNQTATSKLEKYKKDAQTSSRPSLATQKSGFSFRESGSQLAPSNQFRRYLDDTENVFWEDSWQLKKLKLCQFLKKWLLLLFFILLAAYIIIKGIKPIPQNKCPLHAQCGVFVHCNKGYIRQDNTCILDPVIKQQAKDIVAAVVQQLKLDYGAKDCQSQDLGVPSKRTLQIFNEFNVDTQQLKNEIYALLENAQNAEQQKFKYQNFAVLPAEKVQPLSCKIQLFCKTPTFYAYVLALLLLIVTGLKLIAHLQLKQQARQAYSFLSRECRENEWVRIQDHRDKLKWMLGVWNEDLWREIDRLRYEQRAIVYFEENNELYWKICS